MRNAAMAVTGTVGGALERARTVLEAAGVPEPRREAAELYGLLARCPSGEAWLRRDAMVSDSLSARLDEAARRRAAGWPQAYAAGATSFRGHWLAVDRRALIPRAETEGLVDLALAWIRTAAPGRRTPLRVAEPCTGSGAIAAAIALEAPAGSVRVVATDCSAEALALARENLAALGVSDLVELRHGDLLEPVPDGAVDAVVGNPPYVAAGEWPGLEPGVRDFEPRQALVSGPDGLAATRALVAAAHERLTPGGLLALEVDARRAARAASLARAAGFASCEIIHDLFGRPRYLRGWRAANGSDQ